MKTAINTTCNQDAIKDEELVKLIPGFTNRNAVINGINIHYVEGGQGQPLVLIPGWPQTWWAFHKMMPALAEKLVFVQVTDGIRPLHRILKTIRNMRRY